VPLIVMFCPAVTTVDERPVIVGAVGAVTVKVAALVPMSPLTVTLIVPLGAPAGTVATSWFGVAEVTVAETPPKRTTSSLITEEKQPPLIVTGVPAPPEVGTNEATDNAGVPPFWMDVMFPTAS
jgi:hypothetical protein